MSSKKSISREIRKVLYGSASLLAGLTFTGAVQAQDTTGGDVLEEVVVRGIRASLQQSIQTKREAVGVVDAITAEDVGKFPDKNLAEALQRVPGIVINREFGEGERVNLRGTGASLTRTLLNGHGLATADWFILDQLNTTRSFNYLMLPADIIGKVTVYKSPRADIEEGGIGGTIDVATRSPMSLPANTIYLSLQEAYTERSDELDPQASAFYSWRDDDDKFGVVAAATYQERNIRRDGVEVLGYFDADPGAATVLAPSLIGSALFQQERIRQGANIGIEFRPAESVKVNLTGLYSEFQADNLNENFLAWGVRAVGNGGTLTNATMQGDTAVAGTISSLNGGTQDFGIVYDAINRFATATTRNVDLKTDWAPSEDWAMSLRLGTTDARGNTDAQPFVEFGAPGSFTYDLRGRAPQVSFTGVDPEDPSDLALIFSSLHQILNADKEHYLYADAERDMGDGLFKSLKFGVKHTDHDRELNFNATTYGGFHAPQNNTPGTVFSGPLTPGDFLENISSSGTLTSYWQIDRGATADRLFDRLAISGRVAYPQQQYAIEEKTYAGYAMANMEGDSWRGNFGLRYVRTEQVSNGNEGNGGPGSVANPFGPYIPVTVDRSYSDVLPSVSFAFDLSDQLVLRAAAARVMARADFSDIVPRVNINQSALTGSSGDPNIDPYRANQADVSLEWYPDADSIVALAVYYKDIDNYITDRPETRIIPIIAATPPSVACTPLPGPPANLIQCPFLINVRSEGGGAKLMGAEVTFTKPIWGGFGVQGNYTYSDVDTDSGDPLPGNSEDTLNLAAYYENSRVSARLSYTYRSEFFVTFDRSTQLNQDELISVDASAVFNITDSIALTFDGVNLTNEKIEQFATETFRPRAIYDNGRVYWAGVRMKF